MSEPASNEAFVPRRTHRVYSQELKQQIVLETLKPGVSVSSVARRHGINDNIVFEWRRLHRLGKLGLPAPATAPAACSELVPVHVIDSPLPVGQALPHGPANEAHAAQSSGCEVEIEVGKRRVRIRGMSMERAEQFLRECLR